MYASPELYYRTITLENERELEQRLAYRRAAEESPEQVAPRRRTRIAVWTVTALSGFATSRQEARRGRKAQRNGVPQQHPTPAS